MRASEQIIMVGGSDALGTPGASFYAYGETLLPGYHWEFVYDSSGVLVTATTARSSNEPVVAQVRN